MKLEDLDVSGKFMPKEKDLNQEIKQVLKESREEFGPPSYLEKMRNFISKYKPLGLRWRTRDAWSLPSDRIVFLSLLLSLPISLLYPTLISQLPHFQPHNQFQQELISGEQYIHALVVWGFGCFYLARSMARGKF